MTTTGTGTVTRVPYNVVSAIASRSIEMLTMPDVPPIVFVIDDDVSVRESLELLLTHAGWRPRTFESAQEFLACPRATDPSCLVLDVTLPGLNGLELQKQLAGRTDMPIIFITGHGDVPMSVQAMKAGAVEFLTKPFNDDALLDAIRGALERSRAALGHESPQTTSTGQAGPKFLIERRNAIVQRYLPAVNPIVDLELSPSGILTFTNAAVDADVASRPAGYVVTWSRFDNASGARMDLGVTKASDPSLAAPVDCAGNA